MARVLQIRRGNTAQNNNFTGMPGELTMDTTTKTLRVHDGETLGGFTLARADQMSPAASFDITSVPDDFWRETLARLAPTGISCTEGRTMQIGRGSYAEYIFALDTVPLFAQAILVCTNADAGYNTGDMVMSFGIGAHPAQTTIFTDANGIHVRLAVGGGDIWVTHRQSGLQTIVSNDNWRVKFRLYC